MRFKFDRRKSERLRRNPSRRVGFEECLELWDRPHYVDQRSEDPLQYRAVGWARGVLVTVIFEDRVDMEGGYTHLVTLWRATKEEEILYETQD